MDEEVEIEETPKSKKSIVIERLREKYPDSSLEEDEDIFGVIDSDWQSLDSRESERKANNEKLNNIFMRNPRFGSFFMDLLSGDEQDDPGIVFVKHFGKDILDMTDDEESMKKIIDADNEYRSRIKRNEELADEQKSNLENSEPVFKDFQESKNITDDEMNALIDDICNNASNVFMGIFTPEILESAWKSKNFDLSIAQAEIEGEVRGKNEKIGELKKKTTVPDGLPASITSKSGLSNNPNREETEREVTLRRLKELNNN